MYGAKFRQEDEIAIERRKKEQFRQQHQINDPHLTHTKTFKVFSHLLQKYIVTSSFNTIKVIHENGLQVADIINTSHPSEIVCLDVAESTKDIVSYSHVVVKGKGEMSKHFIVHGLEDQGYLLGIDSKVSADFATNNKGI